MIGSNQVNGGIYASFLFLILINIFYYFAVIYKREYIFFFMRVMCKNKTMIVISIYVSINI